MKIICLGAATQDNFLANIGSRAVGGFLALPVKVGSKIDIPHAVTTVGGGATNAAATFAKCGYETLYWGSVGLDFASEFIGEVMIGEGIDITYMQYNEKLPTAWSVIFLDKKGERTIMTRRGAGAHFEQLDPKVLATERPDWLYMAGLGGNFKKIREIIAAARKVGTKVFWNPSGAELTKPAELRSVLPLVDILMVNREEAERIWQQRSYLAIYRESSAPEILIITDGSHGSAVRQFKPEGGQLFVRAHVYEAKLVDRTGAGDAFGSGFLAHFAAHGDILKALQFASANSASVVQQVGGREAVIGLEKRLAPLPMVTRHLARGESS